MKLRYYIIRRLLLLFPVLLGVTLIAFTLSNSIGDPCAIYITEKMNDEQIKATCYQHGITDKDGNLRPIWERYWFYMSNLLKGDLGYSQSDHRPVSESISARLPATMELLIPSLIFAVIVGIPLGITSAVNRNKPVDHATRVLALSGVSIPIFWLGLILQLLVTGQEGVLIKALGIREGLPISGRYDIFNADATWNIVEDPSRFHTGLYTVDAVIYGNWPAFSDAAMHLILPVICLSYTNLAIITRLMRSSMLENLNMDYIRTARSKGVSESVIIHKHAKRNALIPITTVVGLSFGGMLGGAVLTESVFSWPGLGMWATSVIIRVDQAAITSFVLLTALAYVTANLVVDVVYAYLDPRIRLG